MNGKEFARAAHKLLQTELRSRGRGTITEVEDALGMHRRTIKRMRNDNLLRVADLYGILGHLGIRTSTFFLRLEAEIKEGNLPLASRGDGGLGGLPRRSSRDDETLARLREADEMRYNDPVAALRAVSDLRPQVTRATAHFYYSVGGSCFRSMEFFEDGRRCLELAFEAARSEQELAMCHQRLAVTYLLTDPSAALSEAQKAHDLYAAAGDELGKATTWLALATYLRAEGELDAARDCAKCALNTKLLPPRNLVAAHQELGLIELAAGQRAVGLRCLEMALGAAKETVNDRSTTGKLFGLAGRIFRSPAHYDMSVRTFNVFFPFNALALGLEKCSILENREEQEETIRALRTYCRHPSYQRFLDHVYAYVHTGRFASHTFDYSGVWERWRASQTRNIRILAVG